MEIMRQVILIFKSASYVELKLSFSLLIPDQGPNRGLHFSTLDNYVWFRCVLFLKIVFIKKIAFFSFSNKVLVI